MYFAKNERKHGRYCSVRAQTDKMIPPTLPRVVHFEAISSGFFSFFSSSQPDLSGWDRRVRPAAILPCRAEGLRQTNMPKKKKTKLPARAKLTCRTGLRDRTEGCPRLVREACRRGPGPDLRRATARSCSPIEAAWSVIGCTKILKLEP